MITMPYSFVEAINARIANNKNALIVVAGSTGCQPANSKVLMANGEWKNIQDVTVGDKVLSPQKDGHSIFATVKNTTTFFSQNNFDVIELNHSKQKLYSCSSNHVIPFNYRFVPRVAGKCQNDKRQWQIRELTADKFHEISTNTKNHEISGISSFSIRTFDGRKNCVIEPYSLGVFLGDGHYSSQLKIGRNLNFDTMKRKDKQEFHRHLSNSIGITCADTEIMDEVSKYYSIRHIQHKKHCNAKTYMFSVNSVFPALLEEHGLKNKRSGDKFIPKEALLSDIEYRKRLLAGLVDTDGFLSKGKGYSITTKSERLADDIMFIVYSLGGRARKHIVHKGIKKINFVGRYYTVSFFLKDIDIPILVKRKQKDTTKSCYISSNRIAITTKESLPCHVYGFELDSQSQFYITDNYMVTHNSGKSFLALSLGEQLDSMFSIDRVVYSIEDFMDLVHSGKLKKGSVIILDESGVVAPSREWYSLSNRVLNYVLQTFRQDNLIVFFCVPDISFIDSQTRKLFHYFLEPERILKEESITIAKIMKISPNTRTGEAWYIYPRFVEDGNIQVIESIHVRKPTSPLVHLYERKKYEFRMRLGKGVMHDIRKSKDKALRSPNVFNVDDYVNQVITNRSEFERTGLGRTYIHIPSLGLAFAGLTGKQASLVKAKAEKLLYGVQKNQELTEKP
jgi:hypothetical protein